MVDNNTATWMVMLRRWTARLQHWTTSLWHGLQCCDMDNDDVGVDGSGQDLGNEDLSATVAVTCGGV